ncbi:outer membrane protein transport protein [Burkholderia aenigmatica]|uniref:Outer membrane protein P1 n=1 Tax=Burkholderia aenigmatica TaxID=2015348 RepID=A0ABY6XVD7_9BURK|nr:MULTISPECIES: outer membrane protein transport protein [Burkholderia]AYQ44489.1 aromatic hydrocarbon degradation protein [Burkholderia lata]UKD17670.1 outer membrane protein transport protein [Burkholderia aenigmatica]VWC70508.1 Outer membrane protein P1 [Burkholderia aenigmatica]VWC94354.1 Outer membrane protein P1 [Burkholderia aenigmatica]
MTGARAALAAGCLIAQCSSGTVWAQDAFNISAIGASSLAMGGVAAASNVGLPGMMVNPATLGLMSEGSYGELGAGVISANVKAKNEATGEIADSHTRGRNNGPYYAPELAYLWRYRRYALGIGVFASSGVGTEYGTGSFLSRTTTNGVDTGLDNFSRLMALKIPFSMAYQVTDKLTVGGAVEAVLIAANMGLLFDASQLGVLGAQGRLSGGLLSSLMSVPGLSGAQLQFSNGKIAGGAADGWGVSGKLGLTYQATPRTRLGLAYQFKTHVSDLTGSAQVTAVSASAGNIPIGGTVRIVDFQLPASLTVGISQDLSDRLTVAADYQRVFWRDVMSSLQVAFAQDGSGKGISLSLPLNYRDTNVFSIGAQYRYNQNWTFRGGFHYAQEAAPGSGLLAIIPSTPTTSITAGGAYTFNRGGTIDFALGYSLPKRVASSGNTGSSVPISVTDSMFHVACSYTQRF